LKQRGTNRVKEDRPAPLAIAAVDGLVRRELGRQVVPGEVVADFPEDGSEDETIIEGRTTTAVRYNRTVQGRG